MMVLLLENAPESLRGELTRWLIEPRAGVFVGQVTPLVRRHLWKRVCNTMPESAGALLVYSSPTEQGFQIDSWGTTRRRIRDIEGLQLIQRDHPDPAWAIRKLTAKPPEGIPRHPPPDSPFRPHPKRKQKQETLQESGPPAQAEGPLPPTRESQVAS